MKINDAGYDSVDIFLFNPELYGCHTNVSSDMGFVKYVDFQWILCSEDRFIKRMMKYGN